MVSTIESATEEYLNLIPRSWWVDPGNETKIMDPRKGKEGEGEKGERNERGQTGTCNATPIISDTNLICPEGRKSL